MTNNQQPNSILNRLLNDMDEMQTSRHPLQPHGIVNLQEDEKRLYATFLATLLIDQPVSMAQSRLLTMLLESMNLSIQLADLYTSVTEVDKMKLQAFLTLADEKGLSPVFLVDALVLCRLDKSLTENQAKSLAEFVNLMSVDDAMLADAVHLSNKVLRYQENNENAVADAINDKASLTIDFDYELLKHWYEFSYQVLTVEDLKIGIGGKSWLVLDTIDINYNCEIKNANFIFVGNGLIIANSQNFSLKNCVFHKAKLDLGQLNISFYETCFFDSTLNISGKHSVSFEKCMFDNQNENENKDFVSFISRCDSIKICECSFTTKNRTALNFKEEIPSLEVVNCYFENCGNDKTNFIKSAVIINKYSAFVFQNTVFKDNVSKNGKDIYVMSGASQGKKIFNSCQFVQSNKKDISWEEFSKNESSLCLTKIYQGSDIKFNDSIFINSATHMVLENNGYESIFSNCIFKYSPVYFPNYYREDNFVNCSYENSGNSNVIRG